MSDTACKVAAYCRDRSGSRGAIKARVWSASELGARRTHAQCIAGCTRPGAKIEQQRATKAVRLNDCLEVGDPERMMACVK